MNPNALKNPLPRPKSGFQVINDGVVKKVCINKEPHGIICANDGQFGSYANLDLLELNCSPCLVSGSPFTSTHNKWSLLPLLAIRVTCPALYLILVSRSSSGASINRDVFLKLRKTVVNNKE